VKGEHEKLQNRQVPLPAAEAPSRFHDLTGMAQPHPMSVGIIDHGGGEDVPAAIGSLGLCVDGLPLL
jgi:hypothetical protein